MDTEGHPGLITHAEPSLGTAEATGGCAKGEMAPEIPSGRTMEHAAA